MQVNQFLTGENYIRRRVTVNLSRTNQQALDATGRKQYTDKDVVDSMPRGNNKEVEIHFFKLRFEPVAWLTDDQLEREYELRGLIPADPFSLATVNEADPPFADTHPNATHWKDSKGKWCYETFDQWDDNERYVDVDRYDSDWHDFWWFAGVKKEKVVS